MKKWILMASLCLVAVAAQAQSYKEYVRKALDAMSMDSTEVAERLFREAMRVEPAQRSNAMIYYQIGRMQEHRGKVGKSLGELHHGAERGSPCPAAAYGPGQALHAVRQQGEGFGGL